MAPSQSTAPRWLAGLSAVAVGIPAIITALPGGPDNWPVNLPFSLAALLTPANSTAQVFAGTTYYGIDQTTVYGAQQIIPFYLGPTAIAAAVDDNSTDPNLALYSSGWGAGQASTALAAMQSANDPALKNLKIVVLDNDTNRAGGGFWTTYSALAPLLFTSPAPTPSNINVPVVDTAYEYNINSDAPTDPSNLIADLNSLVAYVYDYGGQQTAPMPAQAMQPVAPGAQHYHYIVAPDGTVADKVAVSGNITYVTFETDGLPLVRPLRAIPVVGNALADAIEPKLTKLVNAGYQDDSPIPLDPTVTRPATLLSSVAAVPSSTSPAPTALAAVETAGPKSDTTKRPLKRAANDTTSHLRAAMASTEKSVSEAVSRLRSKTESKSVAKLDRKATHNAS